MTDGQTDGIAVASTAFAMLHAVNSLCSRAVCIVYGLRPLYLDTTAQPTAVDRTTTQNVVVQFQYEGARKFQHGNRTALCI